MNKKVVVIDESESNYIERLFFEYEAGKANIAFLMSQETVKQELLQYYIDVSETRFVELEKAKNEVAKQNEPEELKGKKYSFSFTFDDNSIEYKEESVQ